MSEGWGVVDVVLYIRCQGANHLLPTGWRRQQWSPQHTLRGAPGGAEGGEPTRKRRATRRRFFIARPSGGLLRSSPVGAARRRGRSRPRRRGDWRGGASAHRAVWIGRGKWWAGSGWAGSGWARRCGGDEWCAAGVGGHGCGRGESRGGIAQCAASRRAGIWIPVGGDGERANPHGARGLVGPQSRTRIRRRGFSRGPRGPTSACPTEQSAK